VKDCKKSEADPALLLEGRDLNCKIGRSSGVNERKPLNKKFYISQVKYFTREIHLKF